MKLHNYETGDFIRVAILDEYKLSVAASKIDGGAGVITVDGVRCYVEGEPDTTEATETTETAANGAASACGDPDCTDGVVDGGEYYTHSGGIAQLFYDCPVCRPGVLDELPMPDETFDRYIPF